MSARFTGRTAFITGAGSGIGRAAALRFAAEGAIVAALDIDGKSAEETSAMIQQTGGQALALPYDVAAEEGSMQAASAKAGRIGGRIDVLFKTAGIAVRHSVGEQDVEGLDRVLRVNIRGGFLCAESVLSYLTGPRRRHHQHGVDCRRRGGVKQGGLFAIQGRVDRPDQSLALDYAPEGIRVNRRLPWFPGNGDRVERIGLMHPLGRSRQSPISADAVAFLASDDAAFITGQSLSVDGGFTAGRPEEV